MSILLLRTSLGRWDQYVPHTALEVSYDLIIEISDHNYLLSHVHIAQMVWALLAASEATSLLTASEVKSELSCLTRAHSGSAVKWLKCHAGVL